MNTATLKKKKKNTVRKKKLTIIIKAVKSWTTEHRKLRLNINKKYVDKILFCSNAR